MRVMMDALEISDVPRVMESVNLVAAITEGQKRLDSAGLASIIHIETLDGQAPVAVQLSREHLDGILKFLVSREIITLNRMGVDVKE